MTLVYSVVWGQFLISHQFNAGILSIVLPLRLGRLYDRKKLVNNSKESIKVNVTRHPKDCEIAMHG